MAYREVVSFCRICSGGCGVRLEIDDADRIVGIRGDQANSLTAGYACFKGLQAEESHHGPERLLHPIKRQPDGSYVRIGLETALDEIGEKLGRLVDAHGPRALATFLGNGGMLNIPSSHMLHPFLAALGSDQYFSTLTIDQSAKYVSFGRLGGWAAGYPDFDRMDVVVLFGANPLVSHATLGFLQVDPVRRLKQAVSRGLKLVVIDPRRTETARHAHVFLQPFPGTDAVIAGGVVREILAQEWHDKEFCAAYVSTDGLSTLRRAVDPLTPEVVERLAGLEPGQIHAVAKLFAHDCKVGCVTTATGPSLSPYSNLAQHLADCINVICGRFLRAGEAIHRIDPLAPPAPVHAEVIPPFREWEQGGPSRIRGARLLYGERPSGTLSDEILTPGPDKIRALFIDGGDPMTSFPDQRKTAVALSSLDLLVAIDPWPSPTTKYAHYILPPRMQYERADLMMHLPGYACWPGGWAQFTPPAIRRPKDSEVVEDWYVFWSIAKRLGKTIALNGAALDMEVPPSAEALIDILLKGGVTSIDELKGSPSGLDVLARGQRVQLPRPEANGRFELMPADVAEELKCCLGACSAPGRFERDGKTFSHLLATRRMRDMFNSNGRYVRSVRRRTSYNPAYLHPDDLAALRLAVGDRVELVSAAGSVRAILGEDRNIKRGVVSIAHGWGDQPDGGEDVAATGTAVNALIDTDRHYEAINAMPHMGAVPVDIVPLRS